MMKWRKFSIKRIVESELRSADLFTSQISNAFQFWSLIIFGVLSLICSLFIFYRYLSNSTRRHALHNHAILLIIMTNVILILTDFSWMLDSLRRPGSILSATPAFCMIWWFFDFTLYNAQTVILAWASIERHILIFHSKLVSTRKNRILYHYLPPVIIIIYMVGFYSGVVFFPPCTNEFDFTVVECGSNPCYLSIEFFASWDIIVHSFIGSIIIAIFSLALLYRVIAQKKQLRQPIRWRKHRRMSIQLLSLSAVYLFLNIPLTIIMFVQLRDDTRPQFGFGTQLYIFFLTYGVSLSLPFVVCLSYLSNDKRRRSRRITPILTISQHQRMYARGVPAIEGIN